jgi:hypothetical protein
VGNSASISENKMYFKPTWIQIQWLRETQAKLGGISRNATLLRLIDWARYKDWPDQQ